MDFTIVLLYLNKEKRKMEEGRERRKERGKNGREKEKMEQVNDFSRGLLCFFQVTHKPSSGEACSTSVLTG